ncbi:MAG: FecR domain-containing protein [Verrucomicrobiota bacterium]
MTSEDHPDDFQIFCRLVDGHLSREEWAQLEERLLVDDEFRKRYLLFLDTDFELGQHLARQEPSPRLLATAPGTTPRSSRNLPGPKREFPLLKIAALLMVSLGIGGMLHLGFHEKNLASLSSSRTTPSSSNSATPPHSAKSTSPSLPPSPGNQAPEETSTTSTVSTPSTQVPPTTVGLSPVSDSVEGEIEEPLSVSPALVTIGTIRKAVGSLDPWMVGNPILSGEQVLSKGSVEFLLNNGVRLSAEGPARFTILDASQLHLSSGRIAAEVLPPATGFRVDANGVAVVDYGTRFAVTANDKGDAAVHVYDGLVSASTKPGDQEPFLLRTGETMRLNRTSLTLEPTHFRESLFAAKPAWTGSVVSHHEDLVFLPKPPREATPKALSEGHAILFREKQGLVIRRRIPIDPSSDAEDEFLPHGQMVSSYLLHARGIAEDHRISAEVRFDSPILGIISESLRLDETDQTLGHRRTKYPEKTANRGIESSEREKAFTVSPDGRSLQFSFHSPSLDQLRIIVAEDPPNTLHP